MARTQILVHRWRPRRRISALSQMTWTEFTNLQNLDSLLINCWSSWMSLLNNYVCPFALIRVTSFYSTYDITLIKWLLYLMINLTSIRSFNIYGRTSVKTLKQNVADFGRIPETLLTHQIRKGTALCHTLHILTIFGFSTDLFRTL